VLRRLDADPALRVRLGVEAAATPGLLDDAEVAEAHAAFYADVIDAVRQRAARGRTPSTIAHDQGVPRAPGVRSASSRA